VYDATLVGGSGSGSGSGSSEDDEWEAEVVYEESDREEEQPLQHSVTGSGAAYDCERDGVTACQLLQLCREQEQPVRILDATNRIIAMHCEPTVEGGKTSSTRSRTTLFLKINNKHLYVIDSAKMTAKLRRAITKVEGDAERLYKGRHRLNLDEDEDDKVEAGGECECECVGKKTESGSKAKAKKGRKKSKSKGKAKREPPTVVFAGTVDITPANLEEYANHVIVCPEEDLFSRHQQLVLKHNMCFDAHLYVDQRGRLKQFGDLDCKVLWRSVPDFDRNIRAFRTLFPQRDLDISLVGSLQAMARETFEYPYDGSTFTPLTQSLRDKKCPIFCFDVCEPEPAAWGEWDCTGCTVHALDFSKFYTSCLYDSKHDFLLFNEFSHPQPLRENDGLERADCVYYVTKPVLPTRFYMGPDWYYPELVQYWLKQGYIDRGDVSHYIAAAHTIPHQLFKEHIERTFELFKGEPTTAKALLNSMIGTMRQHTLLQEPAGVLHHRRGPARLPAAAARARARA
jgi:hypothetical protein